VLLLLLLRPVAAGQIGPELALGQVVDEDAANEVDLKAHETDEPVERLQIVLANAFAYATWQERRREVLVLVIMSYMWPHRTGNS
jgi:hypothetical protein